MRTIKKSIFAFSELSDTAKEKAREWYRQDLPVDYDFVFEDAANVADILGLDIRQARKTTMAGIIHYVPAVYFSGFWSQGDGACFEGRYSYKKGWKKTLKAFYNDDELMRIGQALQDLQKKHFYRLGASIKHSGRYYHEYSMGVDCEHLDDTYRDVSSAEKEFKEVFADFARWIYKNLEAEYEHANSNDAIDEALTVGEFEFYENGDVFLGVKKMDLKISDFFRTADPSSYSASAAELGRDAGYTTWLNAMNANFLLLDSEEKRKAFRAFVLESGGWDEEEVSAWTEAELNALCIQWVSSAMREPVGFELCKDTTAEQWKDYERQSEDGTISGRIFKGTDGEVYFYIGS